MIPDGAGWDGLAPDELTPWAALDVAPTLAELEAEANAAADADPVARHDLAYLTPELIGGAATTRANLAAQDAEATRPLTPDEQATFRAIVEAERVRLRLSTLAETLDLLYPIRDLDAAVGVTTYVMTTKPATEPSGPAPTWRTLADVSDDPPRPLLFGMLEPDGPTLAYAAPGTGKGMSGAWLICEAQRAGMLPLIFDAERRPREWARRVSGLGGDRSRVVYLEPDDLPPQLRGRPLWESAPAIGRVSQAAGADLLIVDSIMPAVGLGEERLRSDAQVPYLWVAALDALARPSLSFGHPPKGQPEGEPFGSFAWVAAMRLTWQGSRAEGERHAVRWRPKKRNERGHIPGILLTFAYGDDGRPCSVVRADDEESTRDWILAALVGGPRTVGELAEDLLAEIPDPGAGDVDRIRERLGQALRRMTREGWVSKSGTYGKGVRWGLRLPR
jgi:hypothetical protein